MTEQELLALLEMGDITGQEQGIARQMALADRLRQSPFMSKQGTGWGANLGRAAGGVASAINDFRAGQEQQKLGPMRKDALNRLAQAILSNRRGSTALPPIMPLPDNEPYAGY